jgi:hypothetical protein
MSKAAMVNNTVNDTNPLKDEDQNIETDTTDHLDDFSTNPELDSFEREELI